MYHMDSVTLFGLALERGAGYATVPRLLVRSTTLPTFDRMSVRSHPTGTKVLGTKNADPLPASTTQQERLAVHLVDFYPTSP